jgi:hypothetical protein
MESVFEDNRVLVDDIIELLYLSRIHLFWIMKMSPTSPFLSRSWTTSRYSRLCFNQIGVISF